MTLKQLQTLYRSYDKTFKKLSELHWAIYQTVRNGQNQAELDESNAEKWSSRRKLLKNLDPKMGELMRHEIEKTNL
jgi:hypothetical protein